MGIGLVATLFAVAVLAIFLEAAGVDNVDDAEGFLQVATVLQQTIFIVVAVWFAARVERPRPWHFGLRRTRFWPTLGWTALGLAAYWTLAIVYSALVQPDAEQETLENLGTDESTLWLFGAAILVIGLAPLAEEFFFRAFFYRALRSRLSVIPAALIDGVVFGLVHFENADMAEILPVLAILGVVFCLVYEKTGSLFAVAGLHALNNFIAFGVETEEWGVAGIVGGLMVVGCIVVPRFLPARSVAPA
jgi:membrane protease YdiL (CAAX protease family)